MAWFLNHYECERCDGQWTDEWSCMCDDDCPHCGARHMSPYNSEELTTLIEEEGKEPGRTDTGYAGTPAGRPHGTSDARDDTAVDPQEPTTGTNPKG